jgi:5-methylcytosine-specific restriction endonuclease McrA
VSPAPRRTWQRDRDRATIRRAGGPCGICGQPIDYTLPYLDPGEFVVDHIVPLNAGGPDTLANKQPAHRACNRAKGARTDGGPVLRRSGSLNHPNPRGRDPRPHPPPPSPA